MTNIYVLNSELNEKILEDIEAENIAHKVQSQSKSTYILKISLESNSMKTANKLDDIQNKIKNYYKTDLVIIRSDSSKYYNQKLYILVNNMERKLRELLYLANVLVHDKYYNQIKGLEALDFTQLYNLLFVDIDFMKSVCEMMKKGEKDDDRTIFNIQSFTKKEVITLIESKDEMPLWGQILPDNAAPFLVNNFLYAREFRNAVMHAHNINRKDYNKAKNLYSKIIKEIDFEIDEVNKEPLKHVSENIGELLNNTLQYFDGMSETFKDIAKIMQAFVEPSFEFQNKMSEMNDQILKSLYGPNFKIIKKISENFSTIEPFKNSITKNQKILTADTSADDKEGAQI